MTDPGSAPLPPPTVTTVGEGSASGTPDVLRLHVTVRHRADSISEALAGCASAVEAVGAVARGYTDPESISSRGLHVGQWQDAEGVSSGFNAQHSLEIVCPDLDRSGELIEELAAAVDGRLRVDHVEPFVAVTTAMATLARRRAFDDARAKADELAALAGQRVEHALTVVEGGAAGGDHPFGRALVAGAQTAFEPGTATIGVTVTVTWLTRRVASDQADAVNRGGRS